MLPHVRPERIEPGPGQESVWDYPRPPRLESRTEHIVIVLGGVVIADTRRSYRVCETAGPPTYYLHPNELPAGTLTPGSGGSQCEWKGQAVYWDVHGGDRHERGAAWSYPAPTPDFALIAGWVSVYAGRMDAITLDGEPVTPQPGDFYGGWVTARIVGPFKGGPGTLGW